MKIALNVRMLDVIFVWEMGNIVKRLKGIESGLENLNWYTTVVSLTVRPYFGIVVAHRKGSKTIYIDTQTGSDIYYELNCLQEVGQRLRAFRCWNYNYTVVVGNFKVVKSFSSGGSTLFECEFENLIGKDGDDFAKEFN